MQKIRSSKISNKILSSSGPNHIFEILLPTSSSSERDQSDRFFAKANEPLFKLENLRKLKRRNEKKGKINYAKTEGLQKSSDSLGGRKFLVVLSN